MSILGIDIGGANLKFADSEGQAHSVYFPMWKRYEELTRELSTGSCLTKNIEKVAITMTGEMADCFATRRAGVRYIVDAISSAFPKLPTLYFSVDGNWLSADDAKSDPWSVAASNWRALAQFASQMISLPTLLIDVGSTTTDIINLRPNKVCSDSRTDLDRLTSGELVYTGIERSNSVGLVHRYISGEKQYPIVNELFSTTGDVHRVLANIACDASSYDTADGRDQSMDASMQRLARSLGTDRECIDDETIIDFAKAIADRQANQVAEAIGYRLTKFDECCESVFIAGHGDFLVKAALDSLNWQGQIRSLQQMVGANASRAACAYAVARLLSSQVRWIP